MPILTRFGFLHPAQDQCPTREAFRLSAVVCGLDLGLRPVCRFVVNLAELYRGGTLQQAYWSNVRMHFDTAYDDGKLWSMLCGPAPWFPPEACGGAPKYVGQIIPRRGVFWNVKQVYPGVDPSLILGSMAGSQWWNDPKDPSKGEHHFQPDKDTPEGAVDRASIGNLWTDGSGRTMWEVPPRPELRDFSIKPSAQFLADAAGLLAETFGSRCEFVAAPVNEPDGPTYDPNIAVDHGEGSDQDSIAANVRDIAVPFLTAWQLIQNTVVIMADASTDDGLRRYIRATNQLMPDSVSPPVPPGQQPFPVAQIQRVFGWHPYPWNKDFIAGILARVPGFVAACAADDRFLPEWLEYLCTETDGQPSELAWEIGYLRQLLGDKLKMLIMLDATRAIDGYRGGVPKINDGGKLILHAILAAEIGEVLPSAMHREAAGK